MRSAEDNIALGWSCADELAQLEVQTLALHTADRIDVQLNSPRDCWELVKAACPNPDNVVHIQETFNTITAINSATHADATATEWWADMIGYQDVLASRLRASND
ncbi:MAG: hypothetical protein GY833_23060 [Aestuariibacter sp.]|nr:hypothetical protein [Aestuariibacter sp.]